MEALRKAELRWGIATKFCFIKPARKPQAFKPGVFWRPERSVANPAKPGRLQETLDFSPGSFIRLLPPACLKPYVV